MVTPPLIRNQHYPGKRHGGLLLLESLKTITESTLGTDLALPAKKMDGALLNPENHPGAGSSKKTIPLFTVFQKDTLILRLI